MTEAEEWEAVATDLARFVNYPNADVRGLEPSTFDVRAADAVLVDWLPRVHAPSVVETLATRIAGSGHRSDSARVLIAKYREAPDWQVGDAIARTMIPADHDDVVDLAGDRGAGKERQMLVDALWRITSDAARALIVESLDDPDVCGAADRAARGTRDRDRVRDVATDTLKRIDRARR